MRHVIDNEKHLEELVHEEILPVLLSSQNRPVVLALSGELGAGKSTFVRALGRALAIEEHIISPTFLLIKEYKVTSPVYGKDLLVHVDAYRATSKELAALNLRNIVREKGNIVVVEWADRVRDIIPEDAVWITFEIADISVRRVNIHD